MSSPFGMAYLELSGSNRTATDTRFGSTTSQPSSSSDEAAAAAVALTVKTLLRSSNVAPPEERSGGGIFRELPPDEALQEANLAGGPNTKTAPVAPVDAPAKRAAPAQTAAPTSREPKDETKSIPCVKNCERSLLLEGAFEARMASATPEFRLGAGVAYRPKDWFEVTLGVRTGPGFAVERAQDVSSGPQGAGFGGRYVDVQIPLTFRYRARLSNTVRFLPMLGAGFVWSSLSGSVLRSQVAEPSSTARVDGLLMFGLGLEVALSKVFALGLDLRGGYRPRHQRYLVQGEPVLTLYPVEWSLGTRLIVGLL
jgi:hypothetical protein